MSGSTCSPPRARSRGRVLALGLAVLGLCAWAGAQGPGEGGHAGEKVRFEPVDVYVDSGTAPLAAYQFELKATAGRVAIVGLEGGEHPAFKEAPYYDPAALTKDRVVVAAFSTGHDLPHGRTRVARLHMQVTGEEKPVYAVRLVVAASADGKEIPASVSLGEGGGH